MKKKQIQNSDPSINFRVSIELKNIIEGRAEEKNLTTSKYLRNLLEKVHSGEYCYKEEVRSKIESFLYSKEFLKLMIWIYRKKETKDLEVEKNELDKYIRTLKRIEEYFPQNVSKEFDKVLKDVLDLRDDNGFGSRSKFEFHTARNDYEKLDLKLVEDFFLNDVSRELFINMKGIKNIEVPDLSNFSFPKK
jgi:hypothetical protein